MRGAAVETQKRSSEDSGADQPDAERRRIALVRPVDTLPVSLTGASCQLNCAHCGAHYLEHMQPIWSVPPDHPARSLLISGGCDAQGRVPVLRHRKQVEALRHGRRLNWHVGTTISPATLSQIEPLIDVISYDVVGDAATTRDVYGLERDLQDYLDTLAILDARVPVVPHITIGLHGGRIEAEREALHALRPLDPRAIVFLVLIPTAGTRYAGVSPPPLEEVEALLRQARRSCPDTPLALGCMRPGGRYRQELDKLAVAIGLDAIVNPCRAAVDLAQERDTDIEWRYECCALEL